MADLFLFFLFLPCLFSVSITLPDTLPGGFSYSINNVEKNILSSPNGVFIAGFHAVGENAYTFAVSYSNQICSIDCVVWMANRNYPINGVDSNLVLKDDGNLVLTDAEHKSVWSTNTNNASHLRLHLRLQLQNTGNLVVLSKEDVLWRSFDFPTNTLLPSQKLTRNTDLVSSRANGSSSSGYYKLYFDNDNVIHLLYNGPEISSLYWPAPFSLPWDVGRSTYNDTRIAMLSPLGSFVSSDNLLFFASDYGANIFRRLTLDIDGNFRLYSLLSPTKEWEVSWQAISLSCDIHGLCGPNAFCSYDPSSGRICSCVPGHVRRNLTDWSQGCKPTFRSFCSDHDQKDHVEIGFLGIPKLDFYGYDEGFSPNVSLSECREKCLAVCKCKGFQYKSRKCYPKVLLLNGHYQPDEVGTVYLRLPTSVISSYLNDSSGLVFDHQICNRKKQVLLGRNYVKTNSNEFLVKILMIVAVVIGVLEIVGVFFVWFSMALTHRRDDQVAYHLAPLGFRRYTYKELKKATRNFREEIGSGAGGIVYKAVLSGTNHDRVSAVKRLREVIHGEGNFLAEVSSIGKLNHKNLIKMWGYCAEGKHRLLVYEYMEGSSLAGNLSRGDLEWPKIYDIAIGTARGLAYLHDECLEWILHCDVKPQNILLDGNYESKVADFGLSKLLNRDDANHKTSDFSRIRGTRGYMAPEWVYNSAITSKVDVYSYGVVLLEMITGQKPTVVGDSGEDRPPVTSYRSIVALVREKVKEDEPMAIWIEKIVDRKVKGEIDFDKIGVLVKVAVQCVEEDKDERPSMSQVVEMLRRGLENDESEETSQRYGPNC